METVNLQAPIRIVLVEPDSSEAQKLNLQAPVRVVPGEVVNGVFVAAGEDE